MQNDRSIRIRTEVGSDAPQVINVALGQTYDTLEILSLKLRQENFYKLFSADYGVIVGRVLASGSFGVPNAKVSIFIKVDEDETTLRKILYGYDTVSAENEDGIRYNLLPDEAINACYQNVGTFPNKRFLLDNKDVIEIFDKYWKYTTVTNAAGDYMLFGVPTGQQTVHVDIDLSDIGVLSQRPRDMMYQGFNINQFESPNKFKKSTDINSLAQIKSQDKGVNVFPYWGDTTMDDGATIGITRCDIQIQYDFNPTCIFIGSIITDKASNAIGKNCVGSPNVGNMSELGTGEGSIEMIRKTFDGKIEEFQIKGNRLIDGDGVWCYQIPMNLDYVMTDEFGNTVPTDDPNKGLPTRARVRFRISLDEAPDDRPARKRARYLVPNNPRIGPEYPEFSKKVKTMGNEAIDYEFGSLTLDEDFRDLMWNNVYTVKSYIPRLQSSRKAKNRNNTAIKKVNFAGDNNPMPYNFLALRLGLQYNIVCIVIKVFITLLGTLNTFVIGALAPLTWLGVKLHCLPLNGRFCEDSENTVYFPGCPGNEDGDSLINLIDDTDKWVQRQNANAHYFKCLEEGNNEGTCESEAKDLYGSFKKYKKSKKVKLDEGSVASYDEAELFNCVEQQLLTENESAAFNFANDWINGVLYAPLWFRKIKPKKKFFFGVFTRKAKDKFCSTDRTLKNKIKVFQACSSYKKELSDSDKYDNEYGKKVTPYVTVPNGDGTYNCGTDCQKASQMSEKLTHGIIKRKETLYSSDAYYYAPVEYSATLPTNELRHTDYKDISGEVKLLYATDLVLLGSLNDCDRFGIPQFFKILEPTTYQLPPLLLSQDEEPDMVWDSTQQMMVESGDGNSSFTDMTGCDWGNSNKYDQYYQTKRQWSGPINFETVISFDGGLFYGVNCTSVDTTDKTNINLQRICELGVSLDETDEIENLTNGSDSNTDTVTDTSNLVADGFISKDELYNADARAAFATMNYNNLRTVYDEQNGVYKYDFHYLYPENFDGALKDYMEWYMTKFKSSRKGTEMTSFKTKSGNTVSYRFNYLLESFNRDYYRFRMGKTPYFYDNVIEKTETIDKKEVTSHWHRFPRYENSYYFYFGLKFGKTAIEKFNSQFFSNCENSPQPSFNVKFDFSPNSWCANMSVETRDGYISIDASDIVTPYSVYMKNMYNTEYEFEEDGIEDEKIVYKNKGYTDTVGDFTEHYLDNEEFNSIPNGIYEIQIVDGLGNIVNTTLKFTAPYLSFNTEESVKFQKAFNLIYMENKSSYKNIANIELDDNYSREIGGVIVLDKLVNLNQLQTDWIDFKVKISSYTEFEEFGNHQWSVEYLNDTMSANDYGGTCKENNGTLYFTVPKGDETYSVEVIQMCNGEESGNSNKTDVYIGEPKPLVLYANGVNVDILKTGGVWDAKSSANVGDAWFDMKKEAYYVWDNDPKYKNLSSYAKKEYREGVCESMEKGFIFTEYGGKTLTLRVEGEEDQFPIKFHIVGQTEASNECELSEYNPYYYIAEGSTDFEDQRVEDIGIPNITHTDSFLWKSDIKVEGKPNACWAVDNNLTIANGYDKNYIGGASDNEKVKQVYKCWAITAKGERLPNYKEVSAENNESYFNVIFIDKIMDSEILAWAAPTNFPHFGVTNDGKNKFINENGFVTGRIVNGVANDANGKREFATQKLGTKDIVLKYYTGDDETSYPIRSYIDTGGGKYKELMVYNEITDKQQYTQLSAMTQTLEITDTLNNGISVNVFGDMRLSLDSSNSCDFSKKARLVVSANVSDETVRYYLYEYNGDKHPYDYIISGTNIGTNPWGGTSNTGMFSFQTKRKNLETAAKTITDWSSYFVNPDEPDAQLEKKSLSEGYNQTNVSNGDFIKNSDGYNGQCIVIAESDSGTRCISPVYDFSKISVKTTILVVKQKTVADVNVTGNATVTNSSSSTSGSGTTTTTTSNAPVEASGTGEVYTTSIYIGFKVDDGNTTNYYPKYYDYIIEGVIGGITAGPTTINIEKNSQYLMVPSNTSTLSNYITVKDDGDIEPKDNSNKTLDITGGCTLYVTDVTGLKHECELSKGIDFETQTVEIDIDRSLVANNLTMQLGGGDETLIVKDSKNGMTVTGVTYSGYDTSICSISSNGTVTALSVGSTTVTVQKDGYLDGSATIDVVEAPTYVSYTINLEEPHGYVRETGGFDAWIICGENRDEIEGNYGSISVTGQAGDEVQYQVRISQDAVLKLNVGGDSLHEVSFASVSQTLSMPEGGETVTYVPTVGAEIEDPNPPAETTKAVTIYLQVSNNTDYTGHMTLYCQSGNDISILDTTEHSGTCGFDAEGGEKSIMFTNIPSTHTHLYLTNASAILNMNGTYTDANVEYVKTALPLNVTLSVYINNLSVTIREA